MANSRTAGVTAPLFILVLTILILMPGMSHGEMAPEKVCTVRMSLLDLGNHYLQTKIDLVDLFEQDRVGFIQQVAPEIDDAKAQNEPDILARSLFPEVEGHLLLEEVEELLHARSD